ncbi:uncharacterized protein LOC131605584 [Vicia villosa]|uniref:uncharacterized protein LOC131605584 n=1 Tax=Vicia villosa TaxID=3911 RepID=UPI00273C3741|nr:uncharacterized protein LOC131605584 [Vicia villosa]
MWSLILKARYGDVHKAVFMGAMFKSEKKHSVWWKDMMVASIHNSNFVDCFACNISCGLGVGNSIPFWFGRWLGGSTSKQLFPLLFSLSNSQRGYVSEMGSWQGHQWSWDLHIEAGNLLDNPLAVMEALELVEILADINPIVGGADSFKWWPNTDGIFSVKSCTSSLREHQLERVVDANSLAVIKRFWDTTVPSKINFFGWRLILNRLPVRDQLAHRNIIHREEDKLCVFYAADIEDIDHLFFKCPFSKQVWTNIALWLDVKLVGEQGGYIHLEQFILSLIGKMPKQKVCLVWLTTVWSIWNARNNFMFNNEDVVLDEVIVNIKVVSWI